MRVMPRFVVIGTVSQKGEWKPSSNSDNHLDLDWSSARSRCKAMENTGRSARTDARPAVDSAVSPEGEWKQPVSVRLLVAHAGAPARSRRRRMETHTRGGIRDGLRSRQRLAERRQGCVAAGVLQQGVGAAIAKQLHAGSADRIAGGLEVQARVQLLGAPTPSGRGSTQGCRPSRWATPRLGCTRRSCPTTMARRNHRRRCSGSRGAASIPTTPMNANASGGVRRCRCRWVGAASARAVEKPGATPRVPAAAPPTMRRREKADSAKGLTFW